MNTKYLPARLHQLYPLDCVPVDEVPQEGEEDFDSLNSISDRIIKRLEDEYTRNFFPAQVTMTINTLPTHNSRSCPFWSCPSGAAFMSFSELLLHLKDAHPDTVIHTLKLSEGATEKNEALWRPSHLTHFVITKAPKYAGVFRVCPEAGLEVNDSELRLSVFYNRMINNRVAQGLLKKEEALERLIVNCPKLADMPRKLPTVLNGATEFEQACLLLDGEMTALSIFERQDTSEEEEPAKLSAEVAIGEEVEDPEIESEEDYENKVEAVTEAVEGRDCHEEGGQEEEAQESREGGGIDKPVTTSMRRRKRSLSEVEDTSDSRATKKMGGAVSHTVEEIVGSLSWQLTSKALKELEMISGDLSKETSTKIPSPSLLLKIHKPRNINEAVRYCKLLVEHFQMCDAKKCKHMGKAGPSWVLQQLRHVVADNSTMQDIRRILITSSDLFGSSYQSESL